MSEYKTKKNMQRAKIFATLVRLKFGDARGFKSRAAETLGIQSSNMSVMLAGKVPIAEKHFDTLKRLPDYDPDTADEDQLRELIQPRMADADTWYVSMALSASAKRKADEIARHHNQGQPIELDYTNFSRLVAFLIDKYHESVPELAGDDTGIDPLS